MSPVLVMAARVSQAAHTEQIKSQENTYRTLRILQNHLRSQPTQAQGDQLLAVADYLSEQKQISEIDAKIQK